MHDWVVGGAVIETGCLGDARQSTPGVLLVENERRNGTKDWTTPGGVIDPGEELLIGLAREVREETGLVVASWSGLLYEVVVEAPDLGWRLKVEVHRATAVAGSLAVGGDPDGIVIGANWACDTECADLLTSGPMWVSEPLLEWVTERFESPRRFSYSVAGRSHSLLTVSRL